MPPAQLPTAGELGRRAAGQIRERLPETWRVDDLPQAEGTTALQLVAPDGRTARLVLQISQVVERRNIIQITTRDEDRDPDDVPVVVARYLSESVRAALTERGAAYVDATGNLRIAVDSPSLFLSDRGEDRDPWRVGRPRGTLKGEPAARIARALLDTDRTWSARELVAAAGTSVGATYRVLEYLEREGLTVKEDGRYRVLDWERLLRAWSADAPFPETTKMMTFLEPRGVETFLARLADTADLPAAVTGSAAATEWAPYAPTRAVAVYVPSIEEASERLGLRPNTSAPNVILLEPRTIGDVPFRNTEVAQAGYPVAAPTQVAADLLNGPGREPAEGEHLIEWMKNHEQAWRNG